MGAKQTKRATAGKAGARTEDKDQRREFVAGLFYRGQPIRDIYKQTAARFGVKARCIRNDIKELGLAQARHMENRETVECKMAAAIERLEVRAAANDGAAGNRADEILLTAYGNRALRWNQARLLEEQLALKKAQREFADARAAMTRANLERYLAESQADGSLDQKMVHKLDEIMEHGTASYRDLFALASHALARQCTGPNQDARQLIGLLNLMARIAESDPAANTADRQAFTLPEGMRIVPPAPDEGDELMEA